MNSIKTNLMALHAANTLNSHYGRLATSIERLSTGLRVNSASDDAAGLAIRELMRADVAALSQGQRNANDAISMIQVADGALGIIDEKLIRMKELAEQAATGTYDSTQRLMIDSEFQAMAAEIDRIARATDFNGIKLLDGSLSGAHDGSVLEARGALKIHFGSGNDSAEDFYEIRIGDCTVKGLGLTEKRVTLVPVESGDKPPAAAFAPQAGGTARFSENANGMTLNDAPASIADTSDLIRPYNSVIAWDTLMNMPEGWLNTQVQRSAQGTDTRIDNVTAIFIPAGTTDVVINMCGAHQTQNAPGDNDIQVFTTTGMHLAGTPVMSIPADAVYSQPGSDIGTLAKYARFNIAKYDASQLNTGPDSYEKAVLKYSEYNGMLIGYTGDSERQDSVPNNLVMEDGSDYETLTIDRVTQDLTVIIPGAAGMFIKAYSGRLELSDPSAPAPDQPEMEEVITDAPLSIATQEKAQEALVTIDGAIARKDGIRAHLGAMQNRLENTVSNLSIQAVSLQASESRISDADIALEMTEFVRNQVLTQSAVAMLGQANSYPHMLMRLLG